MKQIFSAKSCPIEGIICLSDRHRIGLPGLCPAWVEVKDDILIQADKSL